jgi:hypothetical protein
VQPFDERLVGVRRQVQADQRVVGVSIHPALHQQELRPVAAEGGRDDPVESCEVRAVAGAARQRDIDVVP